MEKILLSNELLRTKYLDELKSVRQIALETGWGKTTVLNKLYEYGIPVRKNTALRKGMKFNAAWRKNIKENHADVSGKNNPMYGIRRFGSDAPGWKGGLTELISSIRNLDKYRVWRQEVFAKDSFTCQSCGDSKGGNLQADHISPLSYLVKVHNIKNSEDANNRKELWDINNGRVLCIACHKQTDTYGSKASRYTDFAKNCCADL